MASDRRNTYNRYTDMIRRCYNTSRSDYARYGGKGIRVCKRWQQSAYGVGFSNFVTDMGYAPKGLTLDRIDSNKDYSPENCRWATVKEQNNNTSRNRKLTIDGITRNLAQWIELSGLNPSTVRQRYYVYKWDIKRALGIRG